MRAEPCADKFRAFKKFRMHADLNADETHADEPAAHRRPPPPHFHPPRCVDTEPAPLLPPPRVPAGSIEEEDSTGYTALHWAAHDGNVDAARSLLNLGANPNRSNRFDLTPLQVAAMRGHSTLVRVLASSATAGLPTKHDDDGDEDDETARAVARLRESSSSWTAPRAFEESRPESAPVDVFKVRLPGRVAMLPRWSALLPAPAAAPPRSRASFRARAADAACSTSEPGRLEWAPLSRAERNEIVSQLKVAETFVMCCEKWQERLLSGLPPLASE